MMGIKERHFAPLPRDVSLENLVRPVSAFFNRLDNFLLLGVFGAGRLDQPPVRYALRGEPGVVHVIEGFFEQYPEVTVGERVENPPAIPPPLDHSQIPEDAQLMTGGRLAHPHGLRQLPRRKLTRFQEGEQHPDARRTRQSAHKSRYPFIYSLDLTLTKHVPGLQEPGIGQRVFEVRHELILRRFNDCCKRRRGRSHSAPAYTGDRN